ncbi:MAG TPA: hypothetical protein VI564_03825 [Candidatus Nanoarchaeia archaeon]|nr:hypothetical protein [Candidatus Nanoarchaeia archaeon]
MAKLQAKSQSSLEYLLVVAISLAIFVPTTYLFFNYSKDSSQDLSDAQLTEIGRTIIDTAESIYYTGEGSKTVLELSLPDNVRSAVIIDSKELVFNISSNFGISELVFISKVNITTLPANCNGNVCNLPELGSGGVKRIKITATTSDYTTIETV